MKQLSETVAKKCRYGEHLGNAFAVKGILFECSVADYQGEVEIFGLLEDGRYFHYAYSYGSCPVCDEWEGQEYTDAQIVEIMRSEAVYFDSMVEAQEFAKMKKWEKWDDDKMEYVKGTLFDSIQWQEAPPCE